MQVIPNSNPPSNEPDTEPSSAEVTATPGSENRIATRYLVQRKGVLKIVSSPPSIRLLSNERPDRLTNTIQIRNLSKTGIGWVNPVQLFPMEVVEIRLQHFIISAQVVRCRHLSSGDFEVGGVIKGVHAERTLAE